MHIAEIAALEIPRENVNDACDLIAAQIAHTGTRRGLSSVFTPSSLDERVETGAGDFNSTVAGAGAGGLLCC